MSALAELDALREKIAEAERKLAEATLARTQSHRALKRSEDALADYYAQCATGERKPEQKVETELLGEMTRVRAASTIRVNDLGDLEAVDVKAQAEERAAAGEVAKAKAEHDEFVLTNAARIAAEIVPLAEQAEEQMRDALRAARHADQAWREVNTRWGRLNVVLRPAGLDYGDPVDTPLRPLDARAALDALRPPIPLLLTEQHDNQEMTISHD